MAAAPDFSIGVWEKRGQNFVLRPRPLTAQQKQVLSRIAKRNLLAIAIGLETKQGLSREQARQVAKQVLKKTWKHERAKVEEVRGWNR